VPILLDGLKRLEYRGYDSAGIAVIHEGQLQIRRTAGKIADLARVLLQDPLRGWPGVAHTRWATHGKPSDRNAHPHRDCLGTVAVVHNGIIENCARLRKSLETGGHRFESETDTEVVAHLLEQFGDDDLEAAATRAVTELTGAYALGIISAKAPGKLLAIRKGATPLVVAAGDDGVYLASDIWAVRRYARDVLVLEDGEMAVLTTAGARVMALNGRTVQRPMTTIPWDVEAAEKNGYAHFMLKEIDEQPRTIGETARALRDALGEDDHGGPPLGPGLSREDLAHAERVCMVACGTSWHAALIGKHMVESLCRLPVEVDVSSEFRYRAPVVHRGTLTVVISQSGETADTLGALAEARARGSKSLAVCNVMGSSLSRAADGVMYTRVGPEIGVASTKAFTGQLVALYLFAVSLGRARGTVSPDDARRLGDDLAEIPGLAAAVLTRRQLVADLALAIADYPNYLYLGRGINHPLALEGALKLKEISYVHAEGYPAGEMKHGPIALIDRQMPVVVIAPQGRLYEKILGTIEEVKARNGVVIALASDGDQEIMTRADRVLHVPRTSELLSPILFALPLQLLAYHVAVLRCCDVDQPRNLAKSVTVE
jgi:glutamine---fructose-6-phosphate transaminase (isomerizing)